jgi:hypothetical protein
MKVEDKNDQGTDSDHENLTFGALLEVLTTLRLHPQTQYSHDQWLHFMCVIGIESKSQSIRINFQL